ncbi:MAG TPA: VanZ family protein [Longimicrobiales bacterium]
MHVLKPFLPAALWAAAVWIVGGLHGTPDVPSGLGLDKAAHFGMYGVLGWLLGRAWFGAARGVPWLLPLLLALLLGAADELRQRSLTGRSADFADWLADAAGATTGMALARYRAGRSRNRMNADE